METAVRQLPLFGDIPTSSLARFAAEQRPILVVVSDTEEEWDWSARPPFDRARTSVRAMAHVHRGQEIFDSFGIRPCYVIDYPVVSQATGYEPLLEIHGDGRCEIGAHLHPWVNPPHEEQVCVRNSFAGNLSPHLEEEKLRVLNERIGEVFGAPATTYKAGRYGIGRNTAGILERLGFRVDLSVQPPFDYRDQEGPDFSRHPTRPFWFGGERRMLCAPSTGALVGYLGGLREPIYRTAHHPLLYKLRMPGILARTGAVERLRLSNENYTPAENIRLTRWLHARGERVFVFSYHSPSLEAGHSPYVRTEADLAKFLDGFRRYFDFFFGEFGGVTMTPTELRDQLAKGTA